MFPATDQGGTSFTTHPYEKMEIQLATSGLQPARTRSRAPYLRAAWPAMIICIHASYKRPRRAINKDKHHHHHAVLLPRAQEASSSSCRERAMRANPRPAGREGCDTGEKKKEARDTSRSHEGIIVYKKRREKKKTFPPLSQKIFSSIENLRFFRK